MRTWDELNINEYVGMSTNDMNEVNDDTLMKRVKGCALEPIFIIILSLCWQTACYARNKGVLEFIKVNIQKVTSLHPKYFVQPINFCPLHPSTAYELITSRNVKKFATGEKMHIRTCIFLYFTVKELNIYIFMYRFSANFKRKSDEIAFIINSWYDVRSYGF